MKIAICSEFSDYYLNEIDNSIKIYNFTISKKSISMMEIFNSGFSTPARYLMEMLVRVTKYMDNKSGLTSPIIIFNPLYEFFSWEISWVLRSIKISEYYQSDIVILSDNDNIPIAYCFINLDVVQDKECYLCFVSTIDAALDSEYLSKIFSCSMSLIKINALRLKAKWNHNGFYYDNRYFNVYITLTQHALSLLKKNGKNSIKLATIMPHHAGDLLFLSLAAKYTKSIFSHIVVWNNYVDIINKVEHNLTVLPVELAPPFRGGSQLTNDIDYVLALYDQELDKSYLYCYGRGTREHGGSNEHHLIDHYAFQLGHHCINEDDLISKNKTYPPVKLLPSIKKKSIFLHFDAGWSLKVYPKDWQEELIDLLINDGFSITILCDKKDVYQDSKCKRIFFKNLSALTELLLSHHIVVGMDSFPAHLATHILGLPTICLFSNTNHSNAGAKITESYLYLCNNTCQPCYSNDLCPKGFNFCINFRNPKDVFDSITEMFNILYINKELNDQSIKKYPYKNLLKINRKKPVGISNNISYIKIRLLNCLIFLFSIFMKIYKLSKSFVVWIKEKGLKKTMIQVIKVLRRYYI